MFPQNVNQSLCRNSGKTDTAFQLNGAKNSPKLTKIALIRQLSSWSCSNVASLWMPVNKPNSASFLPGNLRQLSYQSWVNLGGSGWLDRRLQHGSFFPCDEHQSSYTNMYQTMYLIRAESLGSTNNQVTNATSKSLQVLPSSHQTKSDFCTLPAAYPQPSQCSLLYQELVVVDKTLSKKDLEALIRQSKILHDCPLLQVGIDSWSKSIIKPRVAIAAG